MNNVVKINILMLVCVLLLGGCAELGQSSLELVQPSPELAQLDPESGNLPELNVTTYVLSCLNEIQGIGPEEFAANFKMAEDGLQYGQDLYKLHFICLSLDAQADYQQFKQGREVLEQYIAEHPNSTDDIQGFKILVDWLDVEMLNKWSAWKTLLEDKKKLTSEVETLQGKIKKDQILNEELQEQIVELKKQIGQLKNIENIIKSRETEQP